jgi:hypothetical protein
MKPPGRGSSMKILRAGDERRFGDNLALPDKGAGSGERNIRLFRMVTSVGKAARR